MLESSSLIELFLPELQALASIDEGFEQIRQLLTQASQAEDLENRDDLLQRASRALADSKETTTLHLVHSLFTSIVQVMQFAVLDERLAQVAAQTQELEQQGEELRLERAQLELDRVVSPEQQERARDN